MYVQDGHTLETHVDVPKNIREKPYAEEQKSLERHQKAPRTSTSSLPPINITNVLHVPSCQTFHLVSSPAGPSAPDMPSRATQNDRLDIPGCLHEQVEDYFAW
ncbi:uncharacterized protein PAC_17852 [Phialocephala subalpina]|uniref:Uncharacterized protein n=1 Tax=Phialocephala subalpina TaxID=576137 RepID=A0A1L7XSD2_9HELO|nr:uncharacterized protein PAC_17852 [Phialocephala subalpina]